MLQLINKKKIYFYFISFVFLSTILNNNFINNFESVFKITEIKIDNSSKEINDIILSNTNFLLGKNIFFVDKKLILEKLNNLKFIESVYIKKKYPSTINIKTKTTDLIATTYLDQKKYFVGLNGNFISTKNIAVEKKLPTIFGKFDPADFIFLKKEIIKHNIDFKKINKYYFHKNKRWDLYFENKVVIQLPSKNISEALDLFKKFKSDNKIVPKTTIDLRIQNRLILRNE